jgi:nucleoside 2-deoxyribosyltransferase
LAAYGQQNRVINKPVTGAKNSAKHGLMDHLSPRPVRAYLAGPDVFLPDPAFQARAKVEICARYGLMGRPPLHPEIERVMRLPGEESWREIYRFDVAMMAECDIIIANLTPFRGASADAGTLVELGWFLGAGKKVFGYSNSATGFMARSQAQVAAAGDALPGLAIEGFGLADNLMVPGAVEYGGGLPLTLPADGVDRVFDALDVFERCAAAVAAHLGVWAPAPL